MRTKAVACVAHRRPRQPNAHVWSPRARFQRPPTRPRGLVRPLREPGAPWFSAATSCCLLAAQGCPAESPQVHAGPACRRSETPRPASTAPRDQRRGRGRRAAPGRPGHSDSTACRIGPPKRRASDWLAGTPGRDRFPKVSRFVPCHWVVDSNMPNVTPCHRHCSRPTAPGSHACRHFRRTAETVRHLSDPAVPGLTRSRRSAYRWTRTGLETWPSHGCARLRRQSSSCADPAAS